MKPGAWWLRQLLHSPLFEPCWAYDDILDWDLVEQIEDRLSGGEQALLRLFGSIDGQRSTNILQDLGAIDGPLRPLVVAAICDLEEGMVR